MQGEYHTRNLLMIERCSIMFLGKSIPFSAFPPRQSWRFRNTRTPSFETSSIDIGTRRWFLFFCAVAPVSSTTSCERSIILPQLKCRSGEIVFIRGWYMMDFFAILADCLKAVGRLFLEMETSNGCSEARWTVVSSIGGHVSFKYSYYVFRT